MEEVEEANKAAVASCHRVLSLLSQPQDQVQFRNLEVETGKAVFRFKKVVSLLNTGLGHARVRKLKKLQIPFPESVLLDNPNSTTDHHSKTPHFLQSRFAENPSQDLSLGVRNSLSLGNPSLELSTNNGKTPIQLAQQALPPAHYHFLQQQQQQQQRLLLQQQSKATLAPKISAEESWLSFDQEAVALHNKVRAFAGWPGTRAKVVVVDNKNGHRNMLELKIITTKVCSHSNNLVNQADDITFQKGALVFPCGGSTLLEVLEIQLPGKKVMNAAAFWNGLRGQQLQRFVDE